MSLSRKVLIGVSSFIVMILMMIGAFYWLVDLLENHPNADTINVIKISISLIAAFMIFLSLMAAYMLIFRIMRPLENLTNSLVGIANGQKDIIIHGCDRSDEIGAICKAAGIFMESKNLSDTLAQQQTDEVDKRNQRVRHMDGRSRAFEQNIQGALSELSQSAINLQNSAYSLSAIAATGKDTAREVAYAATSASQNSEGVACASGELSEAIREISTQVQNSSSVASKTAHTARSVNEAMSELLKQMEQISTVTGFIKSVADQINLLALNATIESARAGEAGKGFAVVAGEVKNLAGQTSKASGEIAKQVNSIQSASGEAESRIKEIVEQIQDINMNISSIAAAIEEQSYATNNIARNVADTSSAANAVTNSISRVEDGADQTSAAAIQVLEYASVLNKQADLIRAEVSNYLEDVRSS